MNTSRSVVHLLVFITSMGTLLSVQSQGIDSSSQCNENTVNDHFLQCYKEIIDETVEVASDENEFYVDGALLCQAYNRSSSYRRCLFSIFEKNELCSKDLYPFSYEYAKIYWKLILSSCSLSNDDCHPSGLSHQTLVKCHYSFDDQYPRQCKEFLRSVQCMETSERDLIPPRSRSPCSINKGFYYYYGDLAARLQLSISVCEQQTSP